MTVTCKQTPSPGARKKGARKKASSASAAYWASWQDAFPAMLQRFPADTQACRRPSPPPVRLQRTSVGLVSKPLTGVPGKHRPCGWQRAAVERALETHLSHLDPASARSPPCAPLAAAAAAAPAGAPHLRCRGHAPHLRCRGHLEPLGDHRSASAQLAPRLGVWRPQPSHSSMQSPRYAGKVVRELHATSGSPT